MAISERDTETPQSLETCQDYILAIMEDIQSIWAKLQSGEWPSNVKSQSEYELWTQKTNSAYQHKMRRLNWLNQFCQDNWGVQYPKKRQLLIAMQERAMQKPGFLEDENEVANIANLQTQDLELIEESRQERHAIQLSMQAQAQMESIMQRLTNARKIAGLTQLQASELLGYESEVVGHYERLRNSPTLLTIFKMCHIYEADPVEILAGKRIASREDLEALCRIFADGQEYVSLLLD